MKQVLVIALLAPLFAVGCMSARYGQYERKHHVVADTLAITKGDVIALSKEGVGDDVIISQLRATNSYFELSKDDIIELKKAGVSEKVITAMIKTSESAQPREAIRGYSWYPYYYPYYGYPWYPSFFLGFSYRTLLPARVLVVPRVHVFRGGHRTLGYTRR